MKWINDMIIRIKNGQQSHLDAVFLHKQSPKICISILEKLEKEGYIRGFKLLQLAKERSQIQVLLKYEQTGSFAIKEIYNISTGGRNVYVSVKNLWQLNNGRGNYFISTIKGILSDHEARLLNVGGTVLFAIA